MEELTRHPLQLSLQMETKMDFVWWYYEN